MKWYKAIALILIFGGVCRANIGRITFNNETGLEFGTTCGTTRIEFAMGGRSGSVGIVCGLSSMHGGQTMVALQDPEKKTLTFIPINLNAIRPRMIRIVAELYACTLGTGRGKHKGELVCEPTTYTSDWVPIPVNYNFSWPETITYAVRFDRQYKKLMLVPKKQVTSFGLLGTPGVREPANIWKQFIDKRLPQIAGFIKDR